MFVVLLGGVYYATRTHPPAVSQPPHAEAYAKMLVAEPAAASASGVREIERPADFDPVEWQQLVSAVRDHPKRDQALQRLVGYLRFQRDTDKWMALKDQPNALERAQVGQRILDALPARFANQEVTGAEALILQAKLKAEDAATADYKARETVITKRFSDQLIDLGQMGKELDEARVAAFK